MRSSSAALLVVCLFISLGLHAQTPDIQSQTRAFLDAYAHGDSKTILAAVDNNTVVYGSDAGEFFRGLDSITTMLANDTRLWSNSAHIGDMQNVTTNKQGNLESIFFQASFTVGNRPPVPVRFCMIWRHTGKHWLLLQSSNAVVTEHQSAAELLHQI
jgi:hypothetical protein